MDVQVKVVERFCCCIVYLCVLCILVTKCPICDVVRNQITLIVTLTISDLLPISMDMEEMLGWNSLLV